MNTWPQYCSPTTECAIDLLKYKYCTQTQSEYEPSPCPEKNYCSWKYQWNATSVKTTCPKGSYCIEGSAEPTKCNFGTYCREGTYYPKHYLAFVLVAVFDIALGVAVSYRKTLFDHLQKQVAKNKGTGGLLFA